MQEEADRLGPVQLAQFFGERDQMIIVNPDEVLRQQHRRQGPRKHPVHTQVTGEITSRELDKRAAKMEQRPEHAVGVPDIVFVEILPREIDGR